MGKQSADGFASDPVNQVTQGFLHSGSDAHEGIHRDVFLAAFDIPNVIPVQFGLFSQLLLTPSQVAAVGSDIFAQHFPVFLNFYHSLTEAVTR